MEGQDLTEKIKALTSTHLTQFTTKETRAEGLFLLGLCFFSISQSCGYINIEKFTLFGANVHTTHTFLIYAVGLVTCYYLILYSVDVYGDWKARSVHKLADLKDDLFELIIDHQTISDQRNAEIDKIMSEQDRLFDEYQRSELQPLNLNDYDTGTHEKNKEVLAIYKERMKRMDERNRLRDAYQQYCETNGLKELLEAQAKDKHQDHIVKQFELWHLSQTTTNHVIKLRFIIEISFPIACGLLAIISLIFHR